MKKPNIKRIIKRLGGPVAVAKVINRTHGAVCQWEQVPVEHCPLLEAWSAQQGKPVTCEEMRPDIYRRLKASPATVPR